MYQRDLRQLGRLIAQQRNQRGLSLRDVEKITGVTNSTLSRLELGEIEKPHTSHLARIAQALEAEPADYYALAGYIMPEGLPELKQYLLVKYGFTQDEAERIDEITQALRGKWGKPI
jgi:transcriptional regulator with XRE-family HTH domain